MLGRRDVDIETDRAVLLEFHCQANYESDSPWARRTPYEEYRSKWLSTSQPDTFLGDLAQSMEDPRTVAEIWEVEQRVAGYVWVTFEEIQDYGLTVAEVKDITVVEQRRREGIASAMLAHAEEVARIRGAHLLRSGCGTENLPSQGLHDKLGFSMFRLEYEKVLT